MPTSVYRFTASGQETVASAFRSVTAAARAAARAEVGVAQAATVGARSAASSSRSVSAQRIASMGATSKLALRVAADQERAAKKGADAEIREMKRVSSAREFVFQLRQRQEAAESRANKKLTDSRREAIGRGVRAAGGILMTGAAAATGLIGAAARDSFRLGDISNRVSISARGAGEKGVDPNVLRREFEANAIAHPGQNAADIAEAVQGFVGKTGRLDIARQNASTFATVASASGTDVKDVAAAAADLFQHFDIQTVEGMQQALAALTEQGRQGSFELKDAAGQFAKLSAAARRFGLDKGAKGVATLGGLTQIAKSATGSPEQAASAVEATLRQLVSKNADIKALGVDVFADKGKTKTRNVEDILVETIAGAKGSLPKLQSIFGEEGIRGISPLISTFNEARNGAKGTEGEKTSAGVLALRAALSKAISTTEGYAGVEKDAATAQGTASAKLSGAWESIVAQVGVALVPALTEAAGQFAKFANTTAMDDLITVFVAVAQAVGLAIDALEFLGLVAPKKQTTDQKIEKAKKELDKQDRELEKKGLDATPEDIKKRAQIAEQIALLEDSKTGSSAEVFSQLTDADAIKKYIGESGGTDEQKRMALYGAAGKDFGQVMSSDAIRGLGEETEAMAKTRTQQEERRAGERINTYKEGGQGEAAAKQGEAAVALKEAAAALKIAAASGGGDAGGHQGHIDPPTRTR